MAKYEVLITAGAERDLQAIHEYISNSGDTDTADRLLDQLLETTDKLRQSPARGSHPRELLALGIKEYRQIFFNPWHLIYSVSGKQILVHLIADGRRDMRSLLALRLLGAP